MDRKPLVLPSHRGTAPAHSAGATASRVALRVSLHNFLILVNKRLALASDVFGLHPLNDLFENIVWLRAHNQVFFGEDQRGHTI